jgi:squalene synthase HpnC
MGVDHYENFPVASVLLPKRLRAPVVALYRFCREADDIADEGDDAPEVRQAALDARRHDLDRIERGENPLLPHYEGVARLILEHRLPVQPFRDLLDAFRQDTHQTRYTDFGELMNYCRRSANPVGRLVLTLAGAATPRNLALSDGICSSLQLINFLQDVAVDWRKGRVYLPQDELARFGITEASIAAGDAGAAWGRMMRFQVERTRRLLQAGAPLARQVGGRLGMELRMVVIGGDRILEKILKADGDVFRRRPVLETGDWPLMAWRALTR